MSPISDRSGVSGSPAEGDLLSLAAQAVHFGAEAYGQWWIITGRSLLREVERLIQDTNRSVPPSTLVRHMLNGYVNWLGQMAAVAPSLAEKVVMEFSDRPHVHARRAEFVRPVAEGECFEVDGKPFPMPARVLDASQGWAMYFVKTDAANRSLEAADKTFCKNLSAFDAGGGRTPLMVTAVDYRNSDFGVHQEFVVALMVTAKDDPSGRLFEYYLAIVVTKKFAREAARVVWGLEKIFCPEFAVRYSADTVRFGLSNRSGKALAIRLPRFGDGHSSDQPTFFLSQRSGGEERRTYWSITTKSGRGEGIQIGGSVLLELGTRESSECVCGDGESACLCDMLRSFDIAERRPAANGWTERQTALFGGPRLLALPTHCHKESTVGKNPGEL
jgi:hypothetical protein